MHVRSVGVLFLAVAALILPANTHAQTIDGGYGHTIAAMPDGTVYTWGDNSLGQLGQGNTTAYLTPTLVASLSNIIAVAAGENHSLALRSDGVVYSWGSYGTLGNGTGNMSTSPVVVSLSLPVGATITAIAAGAGHSLALDTNGNVWVWGHNTNGQLGNGSVGSSVFTPVSIAAFSPAISISAGSEHSLVVKTGGTVWGSGANSTGQLGDGTTTQRTSPVQMTGVTGAVQAAAGDDFSVVRLGTGAVWGVGANGYGQLCSNTGNRTTAAATSLSSVVSISAGRQYFLASETSVTGGDLWGCGRQVYGQLGIGNTNAQYTPVTVPVLNNLNSISANPTHTAVLATVPGTPAITYVWTWGRNYYGQLGDGTSNNVSTSPLLVWTY